MILDWQSNGYRYAGTLAVPWVTTPMSGGLAPIFDRYATVTSSQAAAALLSDDTAAAITGSQVAQTLQSSKVASSVQSPQSSDGEVS